MGSIVTHGAAHAVEDSRCLLCSPIRRDIFTRYHLGTGEGATETVPRGSDGWRLFAPELRREQVLGVPAAPSLVLGSIALLAAIGDLRWIRAASQPAPLAHVPRADRRLAVDWPGQSRHREADPEAVGHGPAARGARGAALLALARSPAEEFPRRRCARKSGDPDDGRAGHARTVGRASPT